MSLACPQCLRVDRLWHNVIFSGWEAVEATCPKCNKSSSTWQGMEVPGSQNVRFVVEGGRLRAQGGSEKEYEWHYAQADGDAGCGECNWEGSVSDFASYKETSGRKREVDESSALSDNSGCGCLHCQWEGIESELVRLGVDGHPLSQPIPGQLTLV